MRTLASLAVLLALSACATAPAAEPKGSAPPVAAMPEHGASIDRRVAAADERLAGFRARNVWPSPRDRDDWRRNLADAEERRRALDAVWPASDAAALAEAERRLAGLEGVLSLLTAADGTFRFGERMRNPR